MTHGQAERMAHKFVWLLSANHRCVLWSVDQRESLIFVALNLWAILSACPCVYPRYIVAIFWKLLKFILFRLNRCSAVRPSFWPKFGVPSSTTLTLLILSVQKSAFSFRNLREVELLVLTTAKNCWIIKICTLDYIALQIEKDKIVDDIMSVKTK